MFTPKAFSSTRSRIGSPYVTSSVPQKRTFSRNPRSSISSRDYGTPNKSVLQTSQLTEEVTQHRLDTYGGVLPVLVTEALAYADKNTGPSVQMDNFGWAWLVIGRRLLVWKYKTTNQSKITQCMELSLPQTSSKYSASLVTLLPHGSADNPPACMAISPEGVVRYWTCVNNTSNYSESGLEVKTGEQCLSMSYIELVDGTCQCVAATSNSALFLVTPIPGQNQLRCRPFHTPQGMLSGISRRMSSFIFGNATQQAIGADLHAMRVGELMENDDAAFYLLCGTNIQKWCLTGDTEKLLYQQNVERLLGDSFAQAIWHQDAAHLPKLQLWQLDMQVAGDAVIVLGAAYNPDVSNQVYYGLGTLHTEGSDPPQSFLSFVVPHFSNTFEENDNYKKMKLLVPDVGRSNAYLYNTNSVTCCSVTDSNHPVDKVDFQLPGDKLFGAGSCEKSAIFFSNTHGLVIIRDIPQTADVSIRESSITMDTSVMEEELSFAVSADKIEEMSMSVDNMQRLKAAFLHFVRGHMKEAERITQELFAGDTSMMPPVDSQLDRLVSMLSQEMIDDIPASDPRWAEKAPLESTSSTNSLILTHQLDGKLKAHEYFIKFLKNMELWDKLKLVTVRSAPYVTRLLLCEHAEKIVSSKALREMHIQYPDMVDAAIEKVLEARGEVRLPPGLTPRDVFYREVSRLEDVLEQLLAVQMEKLSANLTSKDAYNVISAANNILYNTLFEAYQYRITKTGIYQASQPTTEPEYVPWTSSLGPKGIREIMTIQHNLTVRRGLPEAHDTQQRGTLFQQIMEIADMILDGFKTQFETIRQTDGMTEHYNEVRKKYEEQRTQLIDPFMQNDQYERAASLAEKYCDFGILVRLCERTENHERLQRYMSQFQNKGFSDFVFRWYIEEGKRGKLMASSLASHPQLSNFLQAGDNKFMSWLHDINANDFYKAHSTLMELADEEEKYLSKKKTLLSLSKLAALATDDPPAESIKAIDSELDLILNQEQLPQDVLDTIGLDPETMKVLQPHELVELYVGDYNANSNEFDFKKALDLLFYVDKTSSTVDYEGLLLNIWCKAILKDDWLSLGTDDPLENTKDTVFFKTIEMAHADEEMGIKQYLPTADALLNCELLGKLRFDRNFEYLIRAGFEQLHRILP